MVRRNYGGGPRGRSAKPRTEWHGVQDFSVIPTGTLDVLEISNTAILQSMTKPTLLTIYGRVTFATVLSSVDSGATYECGLIIIPDYVTAGFPDPGSRFDAQWIWWHAGIVQSGNTSDVDAKSIERVQIRTKSKRRMNEDDSLFFIVGQNGPSSMDVNLGVRFLFSEGR